MQAMWSFIKSKQFLIQLSIILLLTLITLFFTNKWLASYTHHGESVPVPDFNNLKTSALDDFIKDKEVNYRIIDSIYDPKEEPGIVIRQDPEPKSKVKRNRTVYLYVTGMVAPQISMPKLVDRSERQARLIIETYGLKVGSVKEVDADCNGCVVSQRVRGKGSVEPGNAVKKGSIIDLEIGRKGNLTLEQSSDSTAGGKEEPNFDGNDNE